MFTSYGYGTEHLKPTYNFTSVKSVRKCLFAKHAWMMKKGHVQHWDWVKCKVYNYIVRLYRVVIVASNIVIMRASRAQIIVMYKIQKHHQK